MGCASSNPLVEGGKTLVQTAKESAQDIVNKGDEVIHSVGEATKEGVENVKETVGSMVESAEDSVQNAVHKITGSFNDKKLETRNAFDSFENEFKEATNTIQTKSKDLEQDVKETMGKGLDKVENVAKSTKKEVLDSMESMDEDYVSTVVEEVISDKTKEKVKKSMSVESEKLASELKSAKEMAYFDRIESGNKESILLNHQMEMANEKVSILNDLNDIDNSLKSALKLEDVEDNLEDEHQDSIKKVLERLPTPIPSEESMILEIIPKKEITTFWETAADAYLRKQRLKETVTVELSDSDLEAEIGSIIIEETKITDSDLINHKSHILEQDNHNEITKDKTIERTT